MRTIGIFLAVLFIVSGSLYAQEGDEGRAFLGVMLDMEPLPELLTTHLGLEPGQGVRIQNVAVGSPADKAGLERDDIVVRFGNMEIHHGEELVEAVRESETGQEISLEVIHRGQRREVVLVMEHLKGDVDWKYPTEPEFMQSWRPGRMFRHRPDRQEWEEFDVTEPDMERELLEEMGMHYFFRHEEGEEEVTVAIEGNPYDPDAMVIIRMGEEEHSVRIDEVGELPEEIRGLVKEDIETARHNSRERDRGRRYRFEFEAPEEGLGRLPEFGPEFERFFEEHYRPQIEREREAMERHRENMQRERFGPGQEMFERIEEQMRHLQRRLEELEMQNRELMEHLEHERNRDRDEYREYERDDEPAEHEEYWHEHEEHEHPEEVEIEH